MADKSYIVSLINNPKGKVNLTHKMKEKKLTEDLAYNKAHDPEPVVCWQYEEPFFSGINLGIIGDLQNGVVGVNEIREKKSIEFWENTCNCILVMNGDNNDITYDQSQMKYDNQKSIEWNIDKYEKLAKQGKLVVVLDGNHDGANGKRNVDSGFSAAKHIADAFKVVHVEFAAYLRLTMPVNDFSREKVTAKIAFFHGAGKNKGKAASIDVALEQVQNLLSYLSPSEVEEVPDLIFVNHFHSNTNGIYPFKIPQYNEEGKMIGTKIKYIQVVVESSIQETARYALANAMSPIDSNIYINHIEWTKNPYYCSKTKDKFYKYQLNLTRIPLFKNYSDDYTKAALQYKKDFTEPTKQNFEVMKEYDNLSYEESLLKFENELKR